MDELHAIVSGRVQGVMYRDFVRRSAEKIHLTGMVRNCENGNVEVVAQGGRAELEALAALLHKGSLFSRVSSVETEWRKPHEMFDSFEIVY